MRKSRLEDISYYPSFRVPVSSLPPYSYVGVEHLVKDRGGVCLSPNMPNADSAIQFRPRDILIGNIRPYLKKIWLADITGGASGDVIVVRIRDEYKDSITPDYLYKVLSSDQFFAYDNLNTKGAKMPRGDKKAIAAYLIPIPSIEEQKSIVDELDLLTGIIDKKNAQLRDLDALSQAIFYEMFGNNMSFWPSYKLGDICDTTSGGTPSKSHPEYYLNGTIPWLRSGEVEGTNITNTEIKITDLGVKYSSAKWFPAQTVVVAMYGATVGEVGILGKPMTTNQAVCGILPNDSFRPLYLYSWFRSKKRDFVEQAAGGAQPNISQNIIRNAKICCPPLDVQDSYVERLASIEEQKMIIDCSLKQIQYLLDSRMDHYFNE